VGINPVWLGEFDSGIGLQASHRFLNRKSRWNARQLEVAFAVVAARLRNEGLVGFGTNAAPRPLLGRFSCTSAELNQNIARNDLAGSRSGGIAATLCLW
jgi:hypothetical protein